MWNYLIRRPCNIFAAKPWYCPTIHRKESSPSPSEACPWDRSRTLAIVPTTSTPKNGELKALIYPLNMKQYLDILDRILKEGVEKSDRTGTGTMSIFGTQSRYDLEKGFPLLTTKKLYLKGIIHELLWFLKGDTNIRAIRTSSTCLTTTSISGTNGPTRTETWAPYMVTSGAHGPTTRVEPLTRSSTYLTRFSTIQTPAA